MNVSLQGLRTKLVANRVLFFLFFPSQKAKQEFVWFLPTSIPTARIALGLPDYRMGTPFLSVIVEDGSGYGPIWSWDHTLQEEEFITLGGTGRPHWFMTIYLCVSSEVPIVLSLGVVEY